ncbi:hypothetical protein [Nocardia crassostreae]|uniref:hypothetical protein n=1 Tax=Nocardia crassostreae TaxID=53428 RepID=UPI001470F94B
MRDLALLTAVPDTEAWLWPLIIEGSRTQATVALLALAHSPRTNTPRVDDLNAADMSGSVHAEGTRADAPPEAAHPRSTSGSVHTNRVRGLRGHRLDEPMTERWSQVAAAICDRDPAEVSIVLAKHFDTAIRPASPPRTNAAPNALADTAICASRQALEEFHTYEGNSAW